MNKRSALITGIILVLVLVAVAGAYTYTTYLANRPTKPSPVASLMPTESYSPLPSQLATMSATPSASIKPTVGASTVVERFYGWYIGCVTGGCDYKTSPDAGSQLAKNLEGKANPIICDATPPRSFNVEPQIEQPNNQAGTYVNAEYPDGKKRKILVDLEVDGVVWKVVNVTCPRI